MVGVLRGGADNGGKYFVWVESGGTRTHVVWPSGFVARLDPLEVADPDGNVVAHEGDLIQLVGAAGSADHDVEDAVGASQVFIVHSQPVALTPHSRPESRLHSVTTPLLPIALSYCRLAAVPSLQSSLPEADNRR